MGFPTGTILWVLRDAHARLTGRDRRRVDGGSERLQVNGKSVRFHLPDQVLAMNTPKLRTWRSFRLAARSIGREVPWVVARVEVWLLPVWRVVTAWDGRGQAPSHLGGVGYVPHSLPYC